MKIIKKIFHIIFSSFLIWQTFILAERLWHNPPTDFLDRFIDAIFVNIFVTGIFTIVYSFPAYKLLPSIYYKIKNPKLLKLCGQIIKIDMFKKILTSTIWKKNQNKKHFYNGLRNGLNEFEIRTMQSEFGHFVGFCIVTILAISIGITADLTIGIMILFINIIFNLYPFMLQRFHRLRINELQEKLLIDKGLFLKY